MKILQSTHATHYPTKIEVGSGQKGVEAVVIQAPELAKFCGVLVQHRQSLCMDAASLCPCLASVFGEDKEASKPWKKVKYDSKFSRSFSLLSTRSLPPSTIHLVSSRSDARITRSNYV